MTVVVDDASLRRAWKRVEGDFLWEFVPDSERSDLSAVSEAIEAVNALIPYGTGAWCAPPLVTERGTAVAELYADPDWAEDRRWFDLVAAALAERGLSGRIVAARSARLPLWIEDRRRRFISAMVGLPVDPAHLASPEQGWGQLGVSQDLVQRVAGLAAAWAGSGISRHYLIRDLYIAQLGPEDLEGPVVHAAVREGAATAVWMPARGKRFHSLGFSTQGKVVLQLGADDGAWVDQLQSLTDLLRAVGALAEVAWCGLAPPLADWAFDARDLNAHFAQTPRLRARFVPDAHGIFVLTPEHLAKARDLSDWRLEELGNDRTLVVHKNLGAWFAQKEPDVEVLEKARADLGPMILTKQDVREHRISLGLPVGDLPSAGAS
ncbi:hypothetical protein [Nocardioides sp. MH1]|uniref:hypothetical protein n=1 Tax=Nocardioides sp. MH1 TaxID=3242490 RepID=UPI00351FC07D